MVCSFNDEAGTPFKEVKHKDMCCRTDFLGVVHDFTDALHEFTAVLAPRPTTVDKTLDLIATAINSDYLSKASASKIRGLLSWMEPCFAARPFRAILGSLAQRQHSDSPPFKMTNPLLEGLNTASAILGVDDPRRRVRMIKREDPIIIAASDGQEKGPSRSIAALFVFTGGERVAHCSVVHRPLLDACDDYIRYMGKKVERDHFIAQVEMLAICLGLAAEAPRLKGRPVIWFCDNSVCVSALTKSSSSSPDLARLASVINATSVAYNIEIWYEYVDSKSNWADGPSREGINSSFLAKHGFTAASRSLPPVDFTIDPVSLGSFWIKSLN